MLPPPEVPGISNATVSRRKVLARTLRMHTVSSMRTQTVKYAHADCDLGVMEACQGMMASGIWKLSSARVTVSARC